MYPKPQDTGGRIIRLAIKTLQDSGIKTPLTLPVDIACSSGPDSVALAHLVAKYGRNLVDSKLITLLHFDHGWRPESATKEPKLVEDLAKELGVNFESIRLPAPDQVSHDNIEADARMKRNAVYEARTKSTATGKPLRIIFTAHHQDDVVETLVWRFFRGELLHQLDGILVQSSYVLRPFLSVTKKEIYEYLKEENLKYTVDPTNQDATRMRARLRKEVFPILREMFPGFQKNILSYRTRSGDGS